MSNVKLIWVTPDAENLLVKIARVSNPVSADAGGNEERLINYMIKHNHWSPFEMVSMCVEINTTRDIGRQILRHRSFSFQEFSQRYAEVDTFNFDCEKECRLQNNTNRQSSIECENTVLSKYWKEALKDVAELGIKNYMWAIKNGIAKECARALLPEGLTRSKMYMSGTLRSWIHYCIMRTEVSTQKEHRLIAQQILTVLRENFPLTYKALKNDFELPKHQTE